MNLKEMLQHSLAVTTAIELIEARRFAASANAVVVRLSTIVSNNCQHTHTTPRVHYSAGGYDHRSRAMLHDECNLCGKRLNEREDPNHYGSFA